MRDKTAKENGKLTVFQSVMKLRFDRFAFQKPSLPCSFHITKPCDHFATSDIIFSRLELFVNNPRLETATARQREKSRA